MTAQTWSDIADALVEKCSSISLTEIVSTQGSIGRILAEPLLASQALPAITHAVMDGFALGSKPPSQYRLVNKNCDSLTMNEASNVVAGGPLPHGTVAVVLARHTKLDGVQLTVSKPLSKDNIRRVGEEAKAGDSLLASNTRIDVRHIALAAAVGVDTFLVRRKPRIALVGLHEGKTAFPHALIMQAMLDSPSLQLTHAGVVRTNLLTPLLKRLALNHDLIVVVAESLEAEIGPLATSITNLGGEIKLYRAALKPAKPLITGRIEAAQVIGLAGTAYATTAAAHLFLQPMLRQLIGMPQSDDTLPVLAAFSRSHEPDRAEALPATLSVIDQRLSVTLSGRFGQLRALANIDGFALVSEKTGDIIEGMPVTFKRLSFPLV